MNKGIKKTNQLETIITRRKRLNKGIESQLEDKWKGKMSANNSRKRDQQQGSSGDARPQLKDKPRDKYFKHDRVRNAVKHFMHLDFTTEPVSNQGIWLNTVVKIQDISKLNKYEGQLDFPE